MTTSAKVTTPKAGARAELLAPALAAELERRIIFGDLPPETRLTEEEIVAECNVSRSPVREALRLLKQDGLITIPSRRGARVAPISVEDLDEVYLCRLSLEALAAEQAALRRTDQDIENMRATLEQLRAALQKSDTRAFFERNVDLTDAIHQSTHQTTLIRLLSSIGKQALRYRYMAYAKDPELMQKSLEFNLEIVEAIRNRRPRHARALTEDVLENSLSSIRPRIEALAAEDRLTMSAVAGPTRIATVS